MHDYCVKTMILVPTHEKNVDRKEFNYLYHC